MKAQSGTLPRVLDLAEKITEDITSRQLSPGDSYLNTLEVARRFRVNGTTANRALQVLTQRGMLVRRQRIGTVIADPKTRDKPGTIRHVHVLVHQQFMKSEGLLDDGMLVGLQRVLPDAEIAINYPPMLEEVPYVEKIIAEVMRSHEPAGFILFRSTAPVQRLCENSGVPTVVSGTLQPLIRNLASIDRDQSQIGELLAEKLTSMLPENGKQSRIIVFMREWLTAGDHRMLDAVFVTLAKLGISAGQVRLRCLSNDPDAVEAEVSALLETPGPVGFLCRSEPLARAAGAAFQKRRIPIAERPAVVVADYWRRNLEALHFPHIQSALSSETWGEKIGHMLMQLAKKVHPVELQEVVPVKLMTE